jgi:hypothetical protein
MHVLLLANFWAADKSDTTVYLSANSPHRAHISQNPESLAANVFKAIIERLKEQQLWTSRMSFGHFCWLFPSSTHTKEQLQVFNALSEQPMTVPTVDLDKVLDLEVSNHASLPTENAQHHFYLRSWIFTLDEMTD